MTLQPVGAREVMTQPRIVHSIPGRVRLRFDRRNSGEAPMLAQRLRGHAAVSSVRWSPSARSLTVEFLPAMTLRDVLLTAPLAAECLPPAPEPARRLDWGRIWVACALALLPLGIAGSVALALATEIAGQANDRHRPG
jgi:hypothetical protein